MNGFDAGREPWLKIVSSVSWAPKIVSSVNAKRTKRTEGCGSLGTTTVRDRESRSASSIAPATARTPISGIAQAKYVCAPRVDVRGRRQQVPPLVQDERTDDRSESPLAGARSGSWVRA